MFKLKVIRFMKCENRLVVACPYMSRSARHSPLTTLKINTFFASRSQSSVKDIFYKGFFNYRLDFIVC